MYTLENYLCTSADDAKTSLNGLLNTNPDQALKMALSIIEATENIEGKKTLRKTASTIARKAEKAIKGSKA
ncbi:hypothetical protein [Vibrio alginolyticus]|uniref:hypothetical protein n=1 Tax=Vibrio alginolyticus TaxID=663 RepID=UPI003753F59B|nr:hypothetical protein [Vibrio parahaemolyticus]